MALTLSNSHYQPKDSKGYYVYALRRDSESMLHQKSVSNNPQDKYQQIRFDRRNINYFLDAEGYLVLQVNGSHSYSGPV